VEAGTLLVFAGAGISKLGPSFLPDWLAFNRSLLEEAKACALRGLPGLDAEAADAVRSLEIGQLPVEAFSDLIARSFAAEGYFTVLDVLDGEQTNANHQALADLARRGVLRTIVTTNFDTLIERAFREADLPLTVLTAKDHVEAAPPAGATALYKIHGSVTDTSTLVDTVGQKLRGLPPEVHQRLGELFRSHHVLVVGYSGADLKFGCDYLAFSGIGPESPGLTWLARPNTPPSPEVAAILGRLGDRGTLIGAELPAFFTTLGVEVPATPATTDAGMQAEVERRAQERIRRFFDEPYIGPLSSAAFCASLLARTGSPAAAAAVRHALADEAERWGGHVPKTAAIVFRTLAAGAMSQGDITAAERWTRMELAFWQAAETQAVRPLTDEARTELRRNSAATWVNLAVAERAAGKLAEARASIGRAIDLANEVQHPGLQALVFSEAATLADQMEEHADVVIELLRSSISAAVTDGGADRLSQSLVRLAEWLTRLGEYDLALAEAERAAENVALGVRIDTAVQIEVVRADIAARRGNPDAAFQRLQPLLGQHSIDTARGAAVRSALARIVGHHPPLRAFAAQALDEVLAAMASGRLPEHGLSNVPDLRHLQALRAALESGGAGPVLALLKVPGKDPEAFLRAHIVLSEFTGFRASLPTFFARLCHMKREQDRSFRLMDVIHGLYFWAVRAGDQERRLEAINLAGIARAGLGDLASAIYEYEQGLPTVPAGVMRDAMVHNLGVLRTQGATPVSLEALRAPETSERVGEWEEQVWKDVDTLLSRGDVGGAITLLRSAASS